MKLYTLIPIISNCPYPFVQCLYDNLSNAASWLIYSDWLEEHGYEYEAQLTRLIGKELQK